MSKVLSAFAGKKPAIKGFDPRYYGLELCQGVGSNSKYPGLYAVEIEVEGTNLPHRITNTRWVAKEDTSLRGGYEYVSAAPTTKDELIDDVRDLFGTFTTGGTVLNNSYRTSTHVHVNVRDMKVNALATFVVLWGTFEDLLTRWCGPTRAGNLFALRMSDSAYAIDTWINGFKTGDFQSTNRDYRYLALNPASLSTFGSVEIRSMRGLNTAAEFEPWISIIDRIRERAIFYANDPSAIATDFSALGSRGLLESVFDGMPDIIDQLTAFDGFEAKIRDGFRRVQPILYVLPWVDVLPEINKVYVPNPFAQPKPKRKTVQFAPARPGTWEDVPVREEFD